MNLFEELLELLGIVLLPELDSENLSCRMSLGTVVGHPAQLLLGHRLELDVRRDAVIGAHFEHLVASHEHSIRVVLLRVLEDLQVAYALLLPLLGVRVEAVEFAARLEQRLLILFARSYLDFGELHQRLELDLLDRSLLD